MRIMNLIRQFHAGFDYPRRNSLLRPVHLILTSFKVTGIIFPSKLLQRKMGLMLVTTKNARKSVVMDRLYVHLAAADQVDFFERMSVPL